MTQRLKLTMKDLTRIVIARIVIASCIELATLLYYYNVYFILSQLSLVANQTIIMLAVVELILTLQICWDQLFER